MKLARGQLTIFGITIGPPTVAVKLFVDEYGFCDGIPLSEKGAAFSTEFCAVSETEPL